VAVDDRELARWRMRTLRLTGRGSGTPEEVVRWLGAVQSQDFGPGKWSVGMRCAPAVTDADLDRAYADGTILRTHVLRPTWHFVAAQDIRWLLTVTAPRIHRLSAFVYRRNDLDEPTRVRAADTVAEALRGGKALTRKEIGALLGADGLRLALLVMHAEIEAVICSGPPRGKQHTYALLDERAPRARRLDPCEALAELALRYVTGHGPATARDLAAWASLPVSEARLGLDAVSDRLERVESGGRTYWYAEPPPARAARRAAHLLQTYDEYVMGYGETRLPTLTFNPTVLYGTEVVGQWKRTVGRDAVTVEVTVDRPVDEADLMAAAQRYGRYLGLPVTLRVASAAPSR
jgi:hypothetical protein